MATKKTFVSTDAPKPVAAHEFASASDAAYKQAQGVETQRDSLESVARYIRMQHPNYPTEKNEELDAALAHGYLLKLSETERGAPREFAHVDGNYIDVTQLANKPKLGTEVLTIAYAVGLSNYDYRMLDNLDKKKIVAEIRDMASTYVSQCKKALHNKLEEIDNPDSKKGKKRSDNKTIRKHYEDIFDKGEAKIKIAQKLGDPDADPVRHKAAVAAFWKVMNKQ
jgi:hypothetical protein